MFTRRNLEITSLFPLLRLISIVAALLAFHSLYLSFSVCGYAKADQIIGASSHSSPLSYTDYSEVLATYVDQHGLVNYRNLSGNQDALDRFLTHVAGLEEPHLNSLSKDSQIAFWLNLYNALAL